MDYNAFHKMMHVVVKRPDVKMAVDVMAYRVSIQIKLRGEKRLNNESNTYMAEKKIRKKTYVDKRQLTQDKHNEMRLYKQQFTLNIKACDDNV